MAEKIYISWEDFHKHTKELAEKIKTAGQFNKIIAISRGGLIPAQIISYELDIEDIQVINISSYDGENPKKDDEIVVRANVKDVDEKTLVIDEVSDTGRTLQIIKQMYPKAKMAAVYAKSKGMNITDIYGAKAPEKWLVFPWHPSQN